MEVRETLGRRVGGGGGNRTSLQALNRKKRFLRPYPGVTEDLHRRSVLPVRQVARHHVHGAQKLQHANVLQGKKKDRKSAITHQLPVH